MQIVATIMSHSTQSLILVSHSQQTTDDFVSQFVLKNAILPYNIFAIEPATKEFGIQQVREIKKEIIYRCTETRLYVLGKFDTASYEAQNAFLKTLEQPPAKTWFILVVENPFLLLPTVRSRAAIHHILAAQPVRKAVSAPLDTALTALIETVDLSVLAGSALSTKAMADPITLFDDIIRFFRQRLPSDSQTPKILRSVLTLRSYVQNNHVDPQNGIDQIILAIHKTYSAQQAALHL